MAVLVVVLAAVTGGEILRAALVAGFVFVVATAWTSLKFRRLIRVRDAERARAAGGVGTRGSAKGNGRGGRRA